MIHTIDWPAPAWVKAYYTSRQGGVSIAPYASFNLADHVGDDPTAVKKNRALLRNELNLPTEPHWLQQVHGTQVINLSHSTERVGDAIYTQHVGQACVIMTADCLPILLCCPITRQVAAIHAGWRSLAAGIVEKTIRLLHGDAQAILAWLGPCIGATAFEVGHDVRHAFLARWPQAESAFQVNRPDHWLCDLKKIATLALHAQGIPHIYTENACTYSDATQWFSYRREGVTGRMASLIMLDPAVITAG